MSLPDFYMWLTPHGPRYYKARVRTFSARRRIRKAQRRIDRIKAELDPVTVTARCPQCDGQNIRIPGASETLGAVDSADMTAECRDCDHTASLGAFTVVSGATAEQRDRLLSAVSFDTVLCWDCDSEVPGA